MSAIADKGFVYFILIFRCRPFDIHLLYSVCTPEQVQLLALYLRYHDKLAFEIFNKQGEWAIEISLWMSVEPKRLSERWQMGQRISQTKKSK